VFAFTYYGAALHSSLLRNLAAKSLESCTDGNELKYALLYTLKGKRDGWIESVIGAWNEQQVSDNAKIKLYAVQFEPKIVSFTKNPGETMEDHFITKTIRAQQVVEGSSYERWECARLSKQLAIDMVDKGQVEGHRKRKQTVRIEPEAPKQRKYTRREPEALSQRGVEAADVLLQFAAIPPSHVAIACNVAAADPLAIASLCNAADPVAVPSLCNAADPVAIPPLCNAAVASPCDVAADPAPPAVSLELVDSRVISALNVALAAKDETITANGKTITAKDETIAAKDDTITAKDETITAKDSVIAAKDETIRVMGFSMNRV